MGSNDHWLIGKTQEEAETYLRMEDISYELHWTQGPKDKELLTQKHVVQVRWEGSRLILTLSGFRTKI